MKNIPVFLFSIILLVACYRDIPENQTKFDMSKVLSVDSMVAVLTDIQLVEGAINVKNRQKLESGAKSNIFLEAVLEKHNITQDALEESMRYYSYRTKELEYIYDQVIINLSKKEGELLKEDKESP
jgi:hypothetical protein